MTTVLSLLCLRLFNASGDMRANGDNYLYEIQLSSIASSSNPACSGASVCQVKPSDQRFSRKVGASDKTKYYVQGDSLLLPVRLPKGRAPCAHLHPLHGSPVLTSAPFKSWCCSGGQRQKGTATAHTPTAAWH